MDSATSQLASGMIGQPLHPSTTYAGSFVNFVPGVAQHLPAQGWFLSDTLGEDQSSDS